MNTLHDNTPTAWTMSRCPFCGDDCLTTQQRTTQRGEPSYRVVCASCGSLGPHASDSVQAIARWNRRARRQPPLTQEQARAEFRDTPDIISEVSRWVQDENMPVDRDLASIWWLALDIMAVALALRGYKPDSFMMIIRLQDARD